MTTSKAEEKNKKPNASVEINAAANSDEAVDLHSANPFEPIHSSAPSHSLLVCWLKDHLGGLASVS